MGLKNVPAVISPNLLHALASMGHGDEIGTKREQLKLYSAHFIIMFHFSVS